MVLTYEVSFPITTSVFALRTGGVHFPGGKGRIRNGQRMILFLTGDTRSAVPF
jgi:hypothetical protein